MISKVIKTALSPALLRMQLRGSGNDGAVKGGKAANNSESDVQTYYINATIRGGNSCARTQISKRMQINEEPR